MSGEGPGPKRELPLAGYILVRLLFGLGMLGLAWSFLHQRPGSVFDLGPEFALAAGLFLGMGVSAALLPRFGTRLWFVWTQLLLDTVFCTALVALTDGPTSAFLPLYFLNIVAAAWLLSPGGAVTVALLDASALVALIGFRGADWLTHTVGNGDPSAAYTHVLMQIFAFLLVGLLSGTLAAKVRSTGRALVEQVERTAAMQVQHDRVLDQLQTGVLILDAAGVVRSANPWALSQLGDVVGRPVSGVLRLEGDRWEESIARGSATTRLRCSRSPLEDGGAVVLLEDVTRLREMEAIVEREERLGAVGRLAAGLAHEIRNPLASLSGSVQLLRDENPSPLYDIALREVKRLNELVEEFLDSARPVRLAVERVDPGLIIADVVASFKNDPRFQGRRVVRNRVRSVPAVRMDGSRFRQVLWNLLLNAAQATADYGNIEITAEQEGDDTLIVRVSDDGVGIAPDRLLRIFDPFYTTRSGGTGLGLANVDRIVRAHGGSVEVLSEPGKGAAFVLRFPIGGPHPGTLDQDIRHG